MTQRVYKHVPCNNAKLHIQKPRGGNAVDEEIDGDVATEAQRVCDNFQSLNTTSEVVQILKLEKVYANGKRAVKNLSFGLQQGECFGFLGVNGAGKTTTMKVLTGDLLPSSGTAMITGFDICKDRSSARKSIGYCPQFDALIDLLTVREHLELYGRFKGFESSESLKKEVDRLLNKLQIQSFAGKLAGSLSEDRAQRLDEFLQARFSGVTLLERQTDFCRYKVSEVSQPAPLNMVKYVLPVSATAVAMLAASTSALDQKIYGLNYDLRQGPDWDPSKCKSSDTIASDLKILADITSNVRTYSLSDCDVSGVLKAAKELSLTVWLGVWVSEDSKVYDAEVAAFKKLISSNLIDDNVVGINVGSEAVYREDITAEQAIKYVTDFKKVMSENDIKVPISITDIIDTFVQYPDMLKAGDIVTINQFPFWEKIEADKAVAQFNKRIQPLLKLAGDMEVIISETGWPTGGSATNGSVASEENGAIYLNDFYDLATEKGWKYYYFAGFDTPYKEKQADDATTVESHFGIYDDKGIMKPAYESLKFTKSSSTSSTSGSSTTASSGSASTSVGAGTVSPGTSSGTSAGKSTGTSDGDSATTTSSSSIASSSSISNEDSGSSQLVAAGLAACIGVVSTMLWSL
ncbi:hypothetical protein JM18_003812 [Phytophthora kernoviae]|uniref:glucan endo-1,3-beta-D-glucosidase n=2 Tax=Phytophthora kernoviae TaxID=325452 RepID=A0A921VAS2_9STRA|nr:hypothetical protein G195_005065 [Phytophthora kernoviae 00238/432]KAG2527335.1 hypothetical protein JM18_003812 [Phytophthora kernoviae]